MPLQRVSSQLCPADPPPQRLRPSQASWCSLSSEPPLCHPCGLMPGKPGFPLDRLPGSVAIRPQSDALVMARRQWPGVTCTLWGGWRGSGVCSNVHGTPGDLRLLGLPVTGVWVGLGQIPHTCTTGGCCGPGQTLPKRTNRLPRRQPGSRPRAPPSSYFPELPAPLHCTSLHEQRTGEVTPLSEVPAATVAPGTAVSTRPPWAPPSSVTLGPAGVGGAFEEDALRTFWAFPRNLRSEKHPGRRICQQQHSIHGL